MTEGWGIPGFLPPAVARRIARDDAREAVEARRCEADRQDRAEAARERGLTLAAEQAQQRGEELTAWALARGQVTGRSVTDILAAARAAGDRDDAITAARLHRDGHGEPARVHIEVGEPVIHSAAKSPSARAAWNRLRHWQDRLEVRWALAVAEEAARDAANDHGLVEGVTLSRRSAPTSRLEARSTRAGGPVHDDGLRIRHSGPVVGIHC